MSGIFPRFPNGRAKALTLSYDDGVEQDIQLIEIMKRYGLKGTFNLSSGLFAYEGTVYPAGEIHRRMTEKQALEVYMNTGHEIAAHTLNHVFLNQLPVEIAVNEVLKDRENLERLFGTIIKGMAYPYGAFSDSVVNALQYCGIAYARTTVSTFDFRIPADWMRLTVTCRHRAPELKLLSKKFIDDKVAREPYLFSLMGHSYEFESDNNWNAIEDFAAYTGNRDDIWYATNMEVYEYITAYKRLQFSVDGKRVKNPTDKKIWFACPKGMIEIDSGAVIYI